MPRPTSKVELIKEAANEFDKLTSIIDSLSKSQREAAFNFDDRDKNIKDVLIHLYEWHQLLLGWINDNLSGIEKPFLPKPYNWKTYPKMNIEFILKHQDTSFNDAYQLLRKAHNEAIKILDRFSNDELCLKKIFPFTGNNSLLTYFVSSTSSHYVWAIKKIKNHIKALGDEYAIK